MRRARGVVVNQALPSLQPPTTRLVVPSAGARCRFVIFAFERYFLSLFVSRVEGSGREGVAVSAGAGQLARAQLPTARQAAARAPSREAAPNRRGGGFEPK